MNILKVSTKFALSLILSLFAFSSIAVAKVDSGPHPPAKVNWLTGMGCDQTNNPCVNLEFNEYDIQFVLRVRFSKKVNDLSPYPGIQFYYNIGNGQYVGFTDWATNAMIVPETLEDGTKVNQVSFPISVSVEDLCNAGSGANHITNFPYNITYHMVADIGTPYPVGAHPFLFPPSIFNIDSVEETTEEVSLTKNVCCNTIYACSGDSDAGIFSEGTPNPTPETSTRAFDNGFEAYPNPFQSTIQVDYHLKDVGEVNIICLDANGKQVAQQLRQHDSKGDFNCSFSTEDWSSGIYFIRLLGEDEVQTLKVIKI